MLFGACSSTSTGGGTWIKFWAVCQIPLILYFLMCTVVLYIGEGDELKDDAGTWKLNSPSSPEVYCWIIGESCTVSVMFCFKSTNTTHTHKNYPSKWIKHRVIFSLGLIFLLSGSAGNMAFYKEVFASCLTSMYRHLKCWIRLKCKPSAEKLYYSLFKQLCLKRDLFSIPARSTPMLPERSNKWR